MHSQEQITLNDTLKDVIVKLSQGIPGALTVCMGILKEGKRIDPQTEPWMLLLDFDSMNIRGSEIWMLYKDVCGQCLNTTIGMLRAWQLGVTREEEIKYALNNRGDGLDIDTIMTKVKEKLANFEWPLPDKENNNV